MHCLLEGGVAELYDPLAAASRFGLASRARCRLCAHEVRGVVHDRAGKPVEKDLELVAANACPACERVLDPSALDEKKCAHCGATARNAEIRAPLLLTTESAVRAQLEGWAREDRVASADELLAEHFAEPSVAAILRSLAEKKSIATVADPFALGGARVVNRSETPEKQAPIESTRNLEAPPPPSAPPRAIVYPLVSVIAADGELHPSEREVVDRFLQSEGLAPLAPHEFAVHRAEDVARYVPPEKREHVIELMCETACADGIPDASEVRVINAYANAWHVPDEKVKFWLWGYEHASASGARQLWLKIRRFLLSSRWENDS